MVSLQGHLLVSICLMSHRNEAKKKKSEDTGRVQCPSVAGLTIKNFLPQNLKFFFKGEEKRK